MNFSKLLSKLSFILFVPLGFIGFFLFRRYTILFVSSGSMEPVIPKASLIFVDNQSQSFGLGEVITYKHGGRDLFTHRIVETRRVGNSTLYKTKGDANDFMDDVVLGKGDIIGKVVFTLPYLGYIVLGLFHPFFLLLFFYVPIGHYFGRLCKRFVNQIIN